MPKLQRVVSGNIFFDDFNNTVLDKRWTFSPSLNSRFSLTDRPGYLRIKHSDSPTYALIDIPKLDNVLFEIKNDYKPAISTDIGGIIVFKTLTDRVELVEYYDPIIDVSRNYLYVRMYKNEDVYDGYGSQDGISWELIGSARVEDAAKIGLVLNGERSILSQNLDVDYVAVYSDRFTYMENLQEKMVAKLYDENNTLIQESIVPDGNSIATFDMFALKIPFKGYVKLYSPTGTELDQTKTGIINPGDEFQFITNIDVKFQRKVIKLEYDAAAGIMIPKTILVNDVNFLLDGITDIGSMEGGFVEGLVTVKNLDDQNIINMEAYVELFKNEYSTHVVELSKDDMGTPLNYQSNIVFDVPANATYSFWLRISTTQVNTLSRRDNFKYRICFRNI